MEKKCPQCTMMVPEESTTCPCCKKKFDNQSRKAFDWSWPVKIAGALILIGFLYSSTGSVKSSIVMTGFLALMIFALMILAKSDAFRSLDEEIVCPHCQKKGDVHTKSVKRKKGISGGKATAAIFTLGFSLLFVGLSRKEAELQAHCSNCGVTYYI